jgi:hypothetical protein
LPLQSVPRTARRVRRRLAKRSRALRPRDALRACSHLVNQALSVAGNSTAKVGLAGRPKSLEGDVANIFSSDAIRALRRPIATTNFRPRREAFACIKGPRETSPEGPSARSVAIASLNTELMVDRSRCAL